MSSRGTTNNSEEIQGSTWKKLLPLPPDLKGEVTHVHVWPALKRVVVTSYSHLTSGRATPMRTASVQVTGLSFTWLELTWNLMGGPSIGLSVTSWHIPKSNLQGMPF